MSKNDSVQRYTWEDAIIEAETLKILPAGAVNTGLRLARNINWSPSDGRPSGLYWKNELAGKVAGVSRASIFRNIKPLKEAGYMIVVNGNLLPVIPESHVETRIAFDERTEELKKSHSETKKSQVDTTESQVETGKSQVDNPYSEDTYTEDVLSEDSSSEVAPAPSLCVNDNDSSSLYEYDDDIEWDTVQTEEVPQSQLETSLDEDTEMESSAIMRSSVRAAIRIRAGQKNWSKMKERSIAETCLSRMERHETIEGLIDEVAAEWEVGEDW